MKKCIKCGAQLPDDEVRCPYCDSEIVNQSPQAVAASDENQTNGKHKKEFPVLSVLGVFLCFLSPIVGLIISLAAYVTYKDKNPLGHKIAKITLIICSLFLAFAILGIFLIFFYFLLGWALFV